jgi:dolichyl-phosphate beta-glucosyltransferase
MTEPFLSIVIPAYNEEARLAPTLQKIYEYLRARPYLYELIVVSDGSRDETARVAWGWQPEDCPLTVIDRKENRGKGYTVREGVEKSRGEFVLFSDADLSTPIEELEKLLDFSRQGGDVVIASRNLPDSRILVYQPWHRKIMGKAFSLLVRWLAVPGVSDSQCGFKLFSRKAVESIFPLCRVDGFSFDVEILFLARRLGLKVKEVAVRWVDSPRSTVSPVRDPGRMFLEILKIRWNAWKGRYNHV